MPSDVHGRHAQALAIPVGNTVNVSTSVTSNGAYLSGDRTTNKEQIVLVRLSATKDCFIRFTDGPGVATNADQLFLAGTEVQKVPLGTNYLSAIRDTEDGKISASIVT